MRALARRAPAARSAAPQPPACAACAATPTSGAVYCRGAGARADAARGGAAARAAGPPGQAVPRSGCSSGLPRRSEVQATPSRWWPTACARSRRHRAQLVTLRGLGYLLRTAVSGPTPRASPSLRARLLLRHPAAGAGAVIAINCVQPVPPGVRAADTAYDRTLLASAKSIGERLVVAGQRRPRACAPTCPTRRSRPSRPTTAAACATGSSGFGGENVAGYDDLPAWRGRSRRAAPTPRWSTSTTTAGGANRCAWRCCCSRWPAPAARRAWRRCRWPRRWSCARRWRASCCSTRCGGRRRCWC